MPVCGVHRLVHDVVGPDTRLVLISGREFGPEVDEIGRRNPAAGDIDSAAVIRPVAMDIEGNDAAVELGPGNIVVDVTLVSRVKRTVQCRLQSLPGKGDTDEI